MDTGIRKPLRRAPRPDERIRDADRSCRALLDAATSEFSAKGFAGARVQDIAARAGVNKQLITYYFGGKDGLYREILRQWTKREQSMVGTQIPLEETVLRYLEAGLADPRYIRLAIWRGLADPDGDTGLDQVEVAALDQDVANLRAAQERGEIGADLDPGFVRLVLMSAVMAPGLLPHTAAHLLGQAPGSPEFLERYAEQLRSLVRRLAGNGPPAAGDDSD
jgi:AcrR family transcriptional regulator